jgi:hypothetical protein
MPGKRGTMHDERLRRFEEDAMSIVRSRKEQLDGARRLYAATGHLPLMGGAGNPGGTNPVHPLGPPQVSGTNITVDTMLNQPTRITRMIMDLTLQRFIMDRIFSSAGGVTGGAVVYDKAQLNELYADRDVQRVAPLEEFPVVTAPRQAPYIAEVEKWGGKLPIPDEAKERNNTALFTNKVRQLANTIVRKLNQRAIEVLAASIAASGQTGAGHNWTTVVTGGASQSNNTLWPAADFAAASAAAEQDELGVVYSLALLNPLDYATLVTVYGAANLPALLGQLGFSTYVSNRVPLGTMYVVAEGQVGEFRVEKPLSSETWREPEVEGTWVQSSVRPVIYDTNPYAVLQFTGLRG